jgi:amino acid transporter
MLNMLDQNNIIDEMELHVSVAPKDAQTFFENYLAAPLVTFVFVPWLAYTKLNKDPSLDRGGWFMPVEKTDIFSHARYGALDVDLPPKVEYPTWGAWAKAAPMQVVCSII